MSREETWTVDQCADEWGVTPSTWRSYVSTGRAPQPLAGYDAQRRRRWSATEVRAHTRPGQGQRRDLLGRRARGLDDLTVGLVMVEPHSGVRVRITSITPGALIPDGPHAGRPLASAVTVALETIDQLAGWSSAERPKTVSAGWLIRGDALTGVPESDPEPEPGFPSFRGYRIVTLGAELSTEDWYTSAIEPRAAEAERPALRRVWLG